MRVYISVDMEGIAGIGHPDPTARGDAGYAAAVDLMVGEANAAVEGAFDGGATEVIVNDSHGSGFNLIAEAMHPSARLLQGQKPLSTVEGAHRGSFGVALFVGYHAMAGHPWGTLAHTWSAAQTLTTLNGQAAGETTITALYLGGLGIPVGLVAGDDALAAEVEQFLPWSESVVVKHGVSGNAAESIHPSKARELVRDGARRAVERACSADATLKPLAMKPPITVGIEFDRAVRAEFASVLPLVRRDGDRGVSFGAENALVAYRIFVCVIRLASLVRGFA